MVLEIEPAELSVLTDCDVSLDALNYLGKRLDGMDEDEYKQCPCRVELSGDQRKLLESGKGIDTEYGKIFVNDEIPFEEHFIGTTFPPYLYNGVPVTVDISYMGLTEMVELPCEELAIKEAVCRIGTDHVSDCKIEVSTFTDLPDDLRNKVMAIEKTKSVFELNKLLKTIDFSAKQEQPMNIFQREVARRLSEEEYNFSFENGEFAVTLNDGDVIKIRKDDVLYSRGAAGALLLLFCAA